MNKILIILSFFLISGCFETQKQEIKEAEIYLHQFNFIETTNDTVTFKGKVKIFKPKNLNSYEYCRYDNEIFEYEMAVQAYKIFFEQNKLSDDDITNGIEWSINYKIGGGDASIKWEKSNFNVYDCTTNRRNFNHTCNNG